MTPEHRALLRTKHAPLPLHVHPILRTQLEPRTPTAPLLMEMTPVHDPRCRGWDTPGQPRWLKDRQHDPGAQQQSRDVSAATRPRKERAEPGISEQPPVRHLGGLTQGSRGACAQFLTPQGPSSNLPHVPSTAREPSAQSQHAAPQACLQSSGRCPWCRSRVRAARRGAARAHGTGLGMLELRGRQRPQLTPDPKAATRGQSHPGFCPNSGHTLDLGALLQAAATGTNPPEHPKRHPDKEGNSQWATLKTSGRER